MYNSYFGFRESPFSVTPDLRFFYTNPAYLEAEHEKLIQIVLMGQPELRTKLAQPHLRQLKQRVALQCRLNPLTDKEVRPYIDSRLKAAGYEGKDLFHPDAVERIAYYSKG